MLNYTTRHTCRVCGSSSLTYLFSLGIQFINDFVSPGAEEAGNECPIELEQCNHCTLVQAKHTAPQDFLYSRHYWYRSGVTQTMQDALHDVADKGMAKATLQQNDIVLDIGSNDGTLLRNFSKNIRTVGVEPATNLAEEGSKGLTHFINDFWKALDFEAYTRDKARLVTALGMFYDLEDPNQFIADIARVLHPEGLFIAQLMCLKNMIDICDAGNLCHEHLEFYTLRSLDTLLSRHGLYIHDIETNDVNGRSYRLYIKHQDAWDQGEDQDAFNRVKAAFDSEETIRSDLVNFYESLQKNKKALLSLLSDIEAEGKTVWVYGASTKGNTLLQYWGLGKGDIVGAADKSPEKWGKVCIGSGIPIHSEEEARAAKPDYFLILPYAFTDEFVEREKAFLDSGGKFIKPLPTLEVIGA